jgi:Protein of unknown function (DUF4231)
MSINSGNDISIQFLHANYICGLSSTSKRMLILLDELEGLSKFQIETLKNRYISLTEEFSSRAIFFALIFHGGRAIVTIGSLIVPALLSIQNTNSITSSVTIDLYWTTWAVSLLVTIFNAILTLFKIDKKYYFLHSVLEHLQSEMWQYIYLTGKYEDNTIASTHANQYVHFCSIMERLKIKQVQEEFYKVSDDTKKPEQKPNTSSSVTAPLLTTLVDEPAEGETKKEDT